LYIRANVRYDYDVVEALLHVVISLSQIDVKAFIDVVMFDGQTVTRTFFRDIRTIPPKTMPIVFFGVHSSLSEMPLTREPSNISSSDNIGVQQ
jgi:hypothetical protein